MSDKVSIKTDEEIEAMREGGKRLAGIMNKLEDAAIPGVSTWELDQTAEKLIAEAGGIPSFKGYGESGGKSFPAAICASLNAEIVHGIPREDRRLKEGDIFKIDIGMEYRGLHTDMARTFPVGKVSPEKQKITDIVREAFYEGVKAMAVGKRLNLYSKAVQKYAVKNDFSVVRGLVGHGIGRELHEYPQIPNYFDRKSCRFRLRPGMTFALEPMINAGTYEIKLAEDGWTFVTKDGKISAHWENTVLVLEDGIEILTETK
ncbi:MAG: type I methionyl aminopeptidase [Candidatus Moranbacteria bacterium]|jgi:methionyl aminopeptidase|nr:type I methionyl aminopeptidase [Candidatus Moranbacteria bacterium]MDX9855699.1 type I methionyl aminopeptidase [Candidatus Moranbacteria bacterium]